MKRSRVCASILGRHFPAMLLDNAIETERCGKKQPTFHVPDVIICNEWDDGNTSHHWAAASDNGTWGDAFRANFVAWQPPSCTVDAINSVVIALRCSWLQCSVCMNTPPCSDCLAAGTEHSTPTAGVAQWYSAGLWAGWSGVRVLAGVGKFSLHHRVQTVSGSHPPSYPMGHRDSFPGGKAAGAWSWPLTSMWCRGQECVELHIRSPHTRSWRGAR
jgi:hypothetical protein